MTEEKISYHPKAVEMYEAHVLMAKSRLSEYYSKELGTTFNIGDYIEEEKITNYSMYWVDLKKLPEALNGNYLILIFDCTSTPEAYKTNITFNEKGVETESITHVDICQLEKFPCILGIRKEKEKIPNKTYLMLDSNTGFIKIGKSKKPQHREKTLQSEKPTIKILFIIDKDIEKELHDEYSCNRVRGEWFNLTNRDIEDIKLKYSL
jgi:hypothetical protein